MLLVKAWKMHLGVIADPHRMSLLLLPRPSDASVVYEEVLGLPLDVILWAHVSRRRPQLIVPASCLARMILTRNFPVLCPTLACSL
jgi:hypothetical protein